jgi:hypothetical protein
MRTHRFGRKIKLPATIAIKHQIRRHKYPARYPTGTTITISSASAILLVQKKVRFFCASSNPLQNCYRNRPSFAASNQAFRSKEAVEHTRGHLVDSVDVRTGLGHHVVSFVRASTL